MDAFKEIKEDSSEQTALPNNNPAEQKPVFEKVKSDLIRGRRNRRTFIKRR